MASNLRASDYLLGIIGGAIGGVLGYYAFFFMVRHALYPMVLPGALVGLGCGAMLETKSNVMGIVCGVCALLLGFFIEWQFAPFVTDRSLGYFITHIHQLRSMTLILIVIGALLGFAFGRGREGGAWLRRSKTALLE